MTEATDSSPELERPPFTPPPVAHAVMVIAALLGVALLWPKAMAMPERAEGVGYLLGALTAAVCGPMLAGWLVHRRDPGDRRAQSRVMLISAAAILLGVASTTLRSDRPTVARQAFLDAAKQAEVARSGDDPRAYEAAAAQAVDAFAVMAQEDGRPAVVHVARSIQALQPMLRSYRARADAFMVGIDQPSDLVSVERIDARLELQRLAHRDGTALIAAYRALPAEVEAGLQGAENDELLAAFTRGYERRSRVGEQIVESELRMLDGYRRMLTVLRDNFGHWRHDPEQGVLFADDVPPEARAEFDAAVASLAAENAELARLDALARQP